MAAYDGLTMSSQPAPIDIMHMPPGLNDMNDGYSQGLDFSAEPM
jgi:hypothetical protein